MQKEKQMVHNTHGTSECMITSWMNASIDITNLGQENPKWFQEHAWCNFYGIKSGITSSTLHAFH